MDNRRVIAHMLDRIEQTLKELVTNYEQYFSGVLKREPMQERETLGRELRRLANRRIVQTDLRFRYQSLATRFHSYGGYWDRILRLMDEGKYVRHLSKVRSVPSPAAGKQVSEPSAEPEGEEADRLYRQLVEVCGDAEEKRPLPSRDQVARLLARQQQAIRERFGDREMEYRVQLVDDKPKITVRPKQRGSDERGKK